MMRLPVCVAVAALAPLTLPVLTYAQKLDKDDKAWQESVRPLMLKEEEKIYKGLKEKADRLEFQKIFWARRDKDLSTRENEYEIEFRKRKAEIDEAYKGTGRPGSETDCGKLAIVFGDPDKVNREMVEGEMRETWTYEAGPTHKMQGSSVTFEFDRLRMSPRPDFDEIIARNAERFVVQPNLVYRFDKSNRLVKLAELLPKASPAQALLREPRQDFPVAVQRLFLKDAAGGIVLMGLVRGDGESLGVAKGATLNLVAAANAKDADGRVKSYAEEPHKVTIGADGSWVLSYRMNLNPGKYTFTAGVLELKSEKGSMVVEEAEVPDLNTGELSLGSVVLLHDIEQKPSFDPAHADPEHPFAAFAMGDARFIPFFGGEVAKGASLLIFCPSFDFKIDPATTKPSGSAVVTILRDGKSPVARAPEQPIDTPSGVTLVGPVVLDYAPGHYVIKVTVKDKVANLERVAEKPLDVK